MKLQMMTRDPGERYRFTCAALSGEVASDVRGVLLQRVNKVISGEKMGSDIPSRFLKQLQKTAGFGTKAVVGKGVLRQAFILQMPV